MQLMGGPCDSDQEDFFPLVSHRLRKDPRLAKIRKESDWSSDSSFFPKTIPEENDCFALRNNIDKVPSIERL
jgi:hypothetical protein